MVGFWLGSDRKLATMVSKGRRQMLLFRVELRLEWLMSLMKA